MKFRTKLAISFCIIALLPLFLFASMGSATIYQQWKNLAYNYKVENGIPGVAGASLRMVESMANRLETRVLEYMQTDAESFRDEDFLDALNKECADYNSYIVLRIDGEYAYIGADEKSMSVVNAAMKNDNQEIYSFAQTKGQLYRFIDVNFKDGQKGKLYIFTFVDNMIPELRNILTIIIVLVLAILVITASIMVYWLNRSIIKPINALRLATQNIRDGNLDFEMKIPNDELGELAADIDALRFRLKAADESKKQQEEMNRQLISNISHDLKTPITTIRGYAEGLLDGVAATPEKQRKYLQTIAVKADDMTRLIEELTEYSRLDVNSTPYDFEEIMVADFFDDMADDFKIELESEEIDFNYSNFASATAVIKADAEQVRRVLNNVVGNAVKYMNKKHRIISMRISEQVENVLVEVEDNGCGIAAKELPRIFDRFYRTDASRHGPQNGSGIGLAIVKKIMEDHGGRVWATSKENAGTVFHMEFPKVKEEQK